MVSRSVVFAVAACLLAAVCVHAQGPTLTGSFNKDDYFNQLNIGGKNQVFGNTAKALKPAKLAQLAFTQLANTLLSVHYHPSASELFTVSSGSFTAYIFINKKLVKYSLKPGSALLFPKGVVHFHFSGSKDSIAYSAFNSATPGAAFWSGSYAKYPSILAGNPTEKDVAKLIKTKTSSTPQFYKLVSGKSG